MPSRKSNVSGGFGNLPRDKRLTVTDKKIALKNPVIPENSTEAETMFLEKILAYDPCHETALAILGHIYTETGEYQKGLELDQRMVRLRPEDPVAHYNLACSLSLMNRVELAAESLRKALNLGFRPLAKAHADPDLRNLRNSPLYQEIIAQVKNRGKRKK